MYINYNYYQIFYYVAKYRSFTQAAQVLMNNQPNITRSIKNLESELGCTLFVRSNRGVTLTPEGEKLYEHIRIAVEHIQAGEAELALTKSLQSGTVSIGASEVALRCLLLPVLKQFRELYPGIHIRISNHSTPQAVSALKNGLVDLAVVTTPVDLTDHMKKTDLCSIQETAVCGSAYAFLARQPLSLSSLCEYPLISLSAQTKTWEFYSGYFSQNHLALRPDLEAATADQILPMVRNNLGIGFVPETFLQEENETSGIFRLTLNEPIPPRCVCLIKNTEHSLGTAARELEKILLAGK